MTSSPLKRVLLSTDDGPDATGFELLQEAVAATPRQWRASGSTVTMPGTGTAAEVAAPEITCAQAVAIGVREFAPDLVVVGVNDGPNVWPRAIHSGTVGGILVAMCLGISGIALSLDDVYSLSPGLDIQDWSVAAWAADTVVSVIDQLPADLFGITVNVPSLNPCEINGVTVTGPGEEVDALRASFVSVLPMNSLFIGAAVTSTAAAEIVREAFESALCGRL